MRSEFLRSLAADKKALPILSFPAAQKLNVSVNELVHSPELQARAMETIACSTPIAASVSLMDLSVEAEAFGASVRFSDAEVPSITGRLVEDEDDARSLRVPEVGAGRTGICIEAIRKAKERIADRPVFAGAIGPYSLAGRLMDVTEIMYACFDEPETVHEVLEKCTEFITSYCLALKEAGADGVIMAEPLAGLMGAEMADEFSCAYVRRIADAVQEESFPLIYHNCGNAVPGMIDELYGINAAAYHFGDAVSIPEILKIAPADMIIMGNISPTARFVSGTPEEMKAAVRKLKADCEGFGNFVLSSGCDIPANASWDNINAFFEAAEL